MGVYMKKTSGITLVELLVSVVILGTILLFSSSFQISSQKITTTVIDDTTLTEELRNTGAIISDEIQRAVYVFPPCGSYTLNSAPVVAACDNFAPFPTTYNPTRMNVNFSRFVLGGATAEFTRRPGATGTGASTWEVGFGNTASPILAMIVAPRVTSSVCGTGNTASCYQFVAYYPVLRSQVSRTATNNSRERLDSNPSNDAMWVLMEYRRSLSVAFNVGAVNLSVPGLNTISIPGVSWGDVGSASGPVADPRKQSVDSIPAIVAGETSTFALASMTSRLSETVKNLNATTCGTCATILMAGIAPNTGFQVLFEQRIPVTPITTGCATSPNDPVCFTGRNSIDERGVTEIRLKLQAGFVRSGRTAVVPSAPIEVFASPRNIAY
jgi:hypothetical protein